MNGHLCWFRMWSEAVDDEKLRLLAFEDRWHFIALLCVKAQGLLDDPGELMLRKVAVKLGLQLRELDEVARRLAEVGLVDIATLQPIENNIVCTPSRPPSHEWRLIRETVFLRDDFTCAYCGRRGVKMECDHVIPVSRGGSNDLENLVASCFDCNRSKRDKTIEEWMANPNASSRS